MITVFHNQSLLDIAIQEHGAVQSIFDWALENNISITENLLPGQLLSRPNPIIRNQEIANYFKDKSQLVAAGFYNQDLEPRLGIGTMVIGSTFKVG